MKGFKTYLGFEDGDNIYTIVSTNDTMNIPNLFNVEFSLNKLFENNQSNMILFFEFTTDTQSTYFQTLDNQKYQNEQPDECDGIICTDVYAIQMKYDTISKSFIFTPIILILEDCGGYVDYVLKTIDNKDELGIKNHMEKYIEKTFK